MWKPAHAALGRKIDMNAAWNVARDAFLDFDQHWRWAPLRSRTARRQHSALGLMAVALNNAQLDRNIMIGGGPLSANVFIMWMCVRCDSSRRPPHVKINNTHCSAISVYILFVAQEIECNNKVVHCSDISFWELKLFCSTLWENIVMMHWEMLYGAV